MSHVIRHYKLKQQRHTLQAMRSAETPNGGEVTGTHGIYDCGNPRWKSCLQSQWGTLL